MRDEEITGVRYMDTTVVRVTPLGEDGSPDHAWAMTYHLDEPVMFGVGSLDQTPSFMRAPGAGICLPGSRPGVVGALVAAYDHPQFRDIQAIAQGLWQRRRTGAAVEVWAESGPGRWWYALAPWWRREWDTDVWPLKGMPDHHTYAVGNCRPVGAYVWPAPCPLLESHALSYGTQLVLGETPVPPPAPGLAPYTGATA